MKTNEILSFLFSSKIGLYSSRDQAKKERNEWIFD
jgi:hypothetical protein